MSFRYYVLLETSLCVYACMVYMCIGLYVYMWVWRLEINIEYLSQLLLTLYFETSLLTKPGVLL